jgi:glutathione peroxidase
MFLSLLLSISFAGVPGNIPLNALDGSKIENTKYEDKVILFVNVASRCGYTKQYSGLQSLYEQFKDRGLVIMGVPCNQFGNQEPGTATEIQNFCSNKYSVSFPLLEKQDVNGSNRSPLYKKIIDSGADIRWNFEKILVNSQGKVVQRFPSSTDPLSEELKKSIEALLPASK